MYCVFVVYVVKYVNLLLDICYSILLVVILLFIDGILENVVFKYFEIWIVVIIIVSYFKF